MALYEGRKQEAILARLQRVKQKPPVVVESLGPQMVSVFKSLQKRQTKFGKIGEVWLQLVPDIFNDHCALESMNRGTLTVLVDSAAHLFELKQLLLSGLEKQLLMACKGAGLRKVRLRRGRWYEEADAGSRRITFE